MAPETLFSLFSLFLALSLVVSKWPCFSQLLVRGYAQISCSTVWLSFSTERVGTGSVFKFQTIFKSTLSFDENFFC